MSQQQEQPHEEKLSLRCLAESNRIHQFAKQLLRCAVFLLWFDGLIYTYIGKCSNCMGHEETAVRHNFCSKRFILFFLDNWIKRLLPVRMAFLDISRKRSCKGETPVSVSLLLCTKDIKEGKVFSTSVCVVLVQKLAVYEQGGMWHGIKLSGFSCRSRALNLSRCHSVCW